jgi:hypothetical protein
MANTRAENFPVYLAEATCNASQRAARSFVQAETIRASRERRSPHFPDKSKFVAVFLLQNKRITHPLERGGATCWGETSALVR